MHDLLTDRVRSSLEASGGSIELDRSRFELPAIHRAARQRRRRNRSLIAAAALVAVVGGGVVVAAVVTRDDPDSIQTITPPTSAAEVDEEPADPQDDTREDPSTVATSSTTPPTTTSIPATVEPVAPTTGAQERIVGTSRSATGVAVAAPTTGEQLGDRFLLPWGDGFLTGTVETIQPSAPPLPDEMWALFPPEVRELFPGGAPPETVGGAAARINEAGYLLQVLDLLERHPEIREWIYREPTHSQIVAEFSTDGDDWTPIEVELPDEVAHVSRVLAVGDRLAIAGTPATVPDSWPTSAAMASTTDLVNWSVQTFSTDAPAELPDLVTLGSWSIDVIATRSGWLADIEVWPELDLPRLLPAELLDPSGWLDWDIQDDGLFVSVQSNDGELLTEQLLPWDDLGIDAETVSILEAIPWQDELGPPRVGTWAAAWGGTPVRTERRRADRQIHPLADAFVRQQFSDDGPPRVEVSRDGVAWEAVPGSPIEGNIDSTFAVDGGTVVITRDHGALRDLVYLVDEASGTWREIDVDGLPPGLRRGGWSDGAAAPEFARVVDGTSQREWEVTIGYDGRRLDAAMNDGTASYRVVETETGALVASEDVDLTEVGDVWNPFEHLDRNEDGWSIVRDPSTGEEIARFPSEELVIAQDRGAGFVGGRPEDPWLVATADGIDWVVVDLSDPPADDHGLPASHAVVNGSTVLVSGPDGWTRYTL